LQNCRNKPERNKSNFTAPVAWYSRVITVFFSLFQFPSTTKTLKMPKKLQSNISGAINLINSKHLWVQKQFFFEIRREPLTVNTSR